MADRINDITWQAHQGSVAAIIQLLNEKLAKFGVRTRAMFSDGVLQILCEASKIDQLEQSTLVSEIQQILESISPRNVRRVNINSRIVQEQQLLWLTEIDGDRKNQLLWSEEITLTKPNIFKQLIQDFTTVQIDTGKSISPKLQPSLVIKEHVNNSRKIKIQAVSCLFLLLFLGWLIFALLGKQLKTLSPLQTSANLTPANANAIKAKAPPHKAKKSFYTPSNDPFAASVKIANQATTYGKTATSSTQLLELAAKWQRASDLMGGVPPSHGRYKEAKIRTQLYKKYSEAAQKEAEKSKS